MIFYYIGNSFATYGLVIILVYKQLMEPMALSMLVTDTFFILQIIKSNFTYIFRAIKEIMR